MAIPDPVGLEVAGDEPSPAARPSAPFTVRVRMLVEVADRPDEIAKAGRLLLEHGWSIRDAGPDETAGVAEDRRALIVDGWLYGVRRHAARAAAEAVERLAARHTLALLVRDAAVVTVEEEARRTYRVIRRIAERSGPLGKLLRLWGRLGGGRPHRLVNVPADLTRAEIERELAHRHLGDDKGLPAEEYVLLPPPPLDTVEAERRMPRPMPAGKKLLVPVALVGSFLCGVLAYGRISAPVLAGSALVVLILAGLTTFASSEPRQPVLRAGFSLVMSGLLVLFGWLAADSLSGVEQVSTTWATVAILVFGGPGFYFAVRASWVSRHAVLLITLAAPVAWAMVSWLGRLMQSIYLDRFGIPTGSVRSTDDLWRYAAVAEPVLTALVFVVIFTAAYGWLRHLHLVGGGTRFFAVTATVLLSVLYAVTAIGVGVGDADAAAGRAAENARAGRSPSAYFGLRGTLMCVRPVGADPIPVENGPVPTDHPVLSFGASGDWIWLWDPARHPGDGSASAFAVRRSDVQLLPPPGGQAGTACPR